MFLCWRPLTTLHDKFTEKMWKTDILIWCKSVIFVSSTYMCWSQMVICHYFDYVFDCLSNTNLELIMPNTTFTYIFPPHALQRL